MRKYVLGISAAAIVALAAGCSSGDDMSGMDHNQTQTSTQVGGATQAEHNGVHPA